MRLPSHLRHPRAAVLARWGRVPGLRTAKVTVAAVLSYVAADLLNTTQAPILAPLTALLVVQLTVYETVTQGIQRVFSVLAGVLVAVGIATFVGLTWWSLGAVVAVTLVLGQVMRLGPHSLEVPISAMLVLAVGGAAAPGAAAGRVYETLLGAAIGVAVNFAIAPPVHVRPAGAAIADLAGRLAEFLRGLAGELRAGWSRAAAERWLAAARALGTLLPAADRSLARAEQSARLNPRGDAVRVAQPRLRTALTAMEYCYIVLRTLSREMFDRTFYLPADKESEAYPPQARNALADVLECAADAMRPVAEVAAGAGSAETARAEVQQYLAEFHRRRERLGRLLLVDPHANAAAWQQYGALLAAVDRLRVEIEAAVRLTSGPWRPPRIAGETRQAVRRVIDAAAEDALPLITDRPRQAVRRVIDVAAEAAAAAAAEAAANLATPDPRMPRRRTSEAEVSARERQAAVDAAAAAAAHATVDMLADDAVSAATGPTPEPGSTGSPEAEPRPDAAGDDQGDRDTR